MALNATTTELLNWHPLTIPLPQVRKQFTIDDHSHYVFTPRDLTSWVLGLMRYPFAASSEGGVVIGSHSHTELLEMWAYEACRLFRDRLVGDKAQEKFDSILNSVVRSDWSSDLSVLEHKGGAMYVTWGSTQTKTVSGVFGRPLGRLSCGDMEEMVAKEVVAYGESIKWGNLQGFVAESWRAVR